MVRDRLVVVVNGEVEVTTMYGPADIVSDGEVIEVKHARAYLHAIGQVIGYGMCFPGKQKRIHLFGTVKDREKYLELARSVCKAHDITATFEVIG